MQEQIITWFKSYKNLETPQNWDNTGLLISNENKESKILLTIDTTSEVVDEAISKKIHYIISYHPIIFTKLSKITNPLLLKIIKNDIAVYCPHTSLDSFFCTKIAEFLALNNFSLSNTYLTCLLPESKTFFWFVEKLSNPLMLQHSSFLRYILPFGCGEDLDNISIDNVIIGVGAAQIEFQNEIVQYNAIRSDKINSLPEKNISKNKNYNCNLIITGEMRHHDMLFNRENQTCVILLEHSRIERFCLEFLRDDMEKTGFEDQVLISEKDRDPVNFFSKLNNH